MECAGWSSTARTGPSRPANRRGERRDWLRGDEFEAGLRRLAQRLPNLWRGTVLDGELTAGRFSGTMAALLGSKRLRTDLRFVVYKREAWRFDRR
jgi:hypothetical protein